MIVYLPITKKFRLSAYYQQLMIYSIFMSLLNHVLNSGHRNETESSGKNKSHNGHCFIFMGVTQITIIAGTGTSVCFHVSCFFKTLPPDFCAVLSLLCTVQKT